MRIALSSHLVALGITSRHLVFFFNDTATTEIYTLSLHDALPISHRVGWRHGRDPHGVAEHQRIDPQDVRAHEDQRSEEHTSKLQSLAYLVCRLLLEKKKKSRYPVKATRKKTQEAVSAERLHQ